MNGYHINRVQAAFCHWEIPNNLTTAYKLGQVVQVISSLVYELGKFDETVDEFNSEREERLLDMDGVLPTVQESLEYSLDDPMSGEDCLSHLQDALEGITETLSFFEPQVMMSEDSVIEDSDNTTDAESDNDYDPEDDEEF